MDLGAVPFCLDFAACGTSCDARPCLQHRRPAAAPEARLLAPRRGGKSALFLGERSPSECSPFDAEYTSCRRCAGVRACGRDQAPCSCSGTAAREPTSRSRTGPRGHRRWRHRCAASAKFEVRRLIPHAAVMDQSFLVHLVHRYCQRTLCGAFLAFWGFCPMGE